MINGTGMWLLSNRGRSRKIRYRTVKMLDYPKIFGTSDTSKFFYFTDHNTNSFATNYSDITSITQPREVRAGRRGII